jgi:hypothetical protein
MSSVSSELSWFGQTPGKHLGVAEMLISKPEKDYTGPVQMTKDRISHALLQNWRPSQGFVITRKKRVRVCTGGEWSRSSCT